MLYCTQLAIQILHIDCDKVLLLVSLPSFNFHGYQLSQAFSVAIHVYTSLIGIKSKCKMCQLHVNSQGATILRALRWKIVSKVSTCTRILVNKSVKCTTEDNNPQDHYICLKTLQLLSNLQKCACETFYHKQKATYGIHIIKGTVFNGEV